MTMIHYRALLLAPFLFATLLLAACDSSDGGDDNILGSFEAQISGAFQDAFEGRAAFATETDPDSGAVFAIGLFNAEDEQDIVVLVGRGDPTRKTYTVSPSDAAEAAGFYALNTQAEEGEFYVAESGTLTLTEVRGDRLAGRFEIEAVSITDETRTITISGTFDAEEGEVEGDLDTL